MPGPENRLRLGPASLRLRLRLRLRVESDVYRLYHSSEWQTDGGEGDFGRHAYVEPGGLI